MDLKKSSITADILHVLSDGKVHTLQEIANIVEVSKKTVYRHMFIGKVAFTISCG